MKRVTILALFAALLTIGFVSALAADAQPAGQSDESSYSSIGSARPAVTLDLSWTSINGGGISYGSGGTRRIGYSVGQSVAGEGSGGSRRLGIGFWYGSTRVCGALKGDMNGIGGLSAADISLLLTCVFLNNGAGTVGGDCNLCYADVNCSGGLSASDVSLELLAVFLGTPFPCI